LLHDAGAPALTQRRLFQAVDVCALVERRPGKPILVLVGGGLQFGSGERAIESTPEEVPCGSGLGVCEGVIAAQGLADVMMSLLGATAAFSSGFVRTAVGYECLANFATAAAVLVLIGAIRTHACLAIARA
jgi:hypothetical protein